MGCDLLTSHWILHLLVGICVHWGDHVSSCVCHVFPMLRKRGYFLLASQLRSQITQQCCLKGCFLSGGQALFNLVYHCAGIYSYMSEALHLYVRISGLQLLGTVKAKDRDNDWKFCTQT